MDHVRKSHKSTSKAAISRYPKLEKAKEPPVSSIEIKDDSPANYISSVYFPYIRGDNCNRLLPNYSTVLGRTAKVGVFVEDLDQLQHDLEKLLSFASVRNRVLREQVSQSSTGKKEYQGNSAKKRKLLENNLSPSAVKRIQLEHKRKLRLSKAGRRYMRGKHRGKGKGLSGLVGACNFGNDTAIRQPRVFIPRNDMSEKFWATVEPFCLDITRDDTCFLDNVLKECSLPTRIHVPEVGAHYSFEWSDQSLSLEKHFSEMSKQRKKFFPLFSDLHKNGKSFAQSRGVEVSYESPLTERIFESLPDGPVPKANGKPETVTSATAMNEQNGQNGTRVGVCLEPRLRREFSLPDQAENQGPIGQSGVLGTIPPDDEILLEIQRCCRELDSVNRNNVVELTKLREKCMVDLKRQTIKTTMNKVDTQVLDLYGDIMKAKQAHAATFTRPNLQQFEKQALDIRNQQIALQKAYSAQVLETAQNNLSDDLSDC